MKQFNDQSILEKFVSRERVFDGLILHIDHVTNELPNGKLAKREVARHIGASAVIPVDSEGFTYLVRQYRAPIESVLMEIPAGKLDAPDEDRLLAAKRELKEETGMEAKEWRHLTDTVTTPGFSSECISLYLARDLSFGDQSPDDDEFLNVVRLPFDEVWQMVMRGEIRDAKTQIAVALAKTVMEDGSK